MILINRLPSVFTKSHYLNDFIDTLRWVLFVITTSPDAFDLKILAALHYPRKIIDITITSMVPGYVDCR